MTIGTNSTSSGSTLTWLIDFRLRVRSGFPLVWSAVCVHAKVILPGARSTNTSRRQTRTTYRGESSSSNQKAVSLPPVHFFHVMVHLKALLSISVVVVTHVDHASLSSHGRLHLMCVHLPFFRDILALSILYFVVHPQSISSHHLICILVMHPPLPYVLDPLRPRLGVISL